MMSKDSSFTLPVILAAARTETSLGGHGLGDAPGRGDDLDHPVHRWSTCCSRATTCPACSAERSSDPRVDGGRRGRAATAAWRARSGDGEPGPALRRRHRRAAPAGCGPGPAPGRLLGRPPGHQPRADDPPRLRAAQRDRARSTTCAWPPGRRAARTRPCSDSSGAAFPFLDTDVYKWLEAAGLGAGSWQRPGARGGRPTRPSGRRRPRSGPTATSTATSRSVGGGDPFRDLAWGHELYCIGHLIQAAVAWHRRLGDDRLLDGRPARRRRTSTGRSGRAARDGIDGHPEIEMALVELWRATGERRYLALARRQIDLRGRGLLGDGRFGREYWQDHRPGPRGRRRSPATPCASCTSTPAPSTSRSRPATGRCSTRSSGAGTTWSRPGRT